MRVESVLLQTQIMAAMSKSQFVTKARFKLTSEELNDNLALYVQQYIERVYIPFNNKDLNEKGVNITVNRPSDVNLVRIFDPMKMVVVVDNLINNSVKAGSKNIEVNLSLPNENTLQIVVKDDGKGIPEADLKEIFKFGFTTTGGTGIGLYHIKKIMDEYGSITINNQVKEGVEFTLKVNRI